MTHSSRFFNNMFDHMQQQNYGFTTTTSIQLSDEIIWLDAVNSSLRRCTAASAMDEADAVLNGFKERFCDKNEAD